MRGIGIVIIGRNEGERLRRCLESVASADAQIVYVDSGSTDASVEIARQMGAVAMELDCTLPFSAARARNAGFDCLLELEPTLQFVQFIDGDCEMKADWLERAAQELERRHEVAVVCGHLRERHPERSIYNRLCQMEWDGSAGEVDACGGIAMYRVTSFQNVHGFNPDLTAGEEPELCLRLRRAGWKIFRLDAEMAVHDANMMRFGQWWRRAVRAGHAYAQGAAIHGCSPERHWVRESLSIWVWGLIIPVMAVLCAGVTGGMSLLLLAGYPLLLGRIYKRMRRRGYSAGDAFCYAGFCVLGKFPQVLGQMQYWWRRLTASPAVLIEYKGSRRPA